MDGEQLTQEIMKRTGCSYETAKRVAMIQIVMQAEEALHAKRENDKNP